MLNAPDVTTPRGCAIERSWRYSWAATATIGSGCAHARARPAAGWRWCIVDLVGSMAGVRTIPMPTWVKVQPTPWTAGAGVARRTRVRPVNAAVRRNASALARRWFGSCSRGMLRCWSSGDRTHDLRRSCAKMCRRLAGNLNRSSCCWGTLRCKDANVPGHKADLVHAPNDGIKLRVAV